jgi:spermidine synthase
VKIRYEDVDREQTPLGELLLQRYEAEGGEVGYQILIDGEFLMASHGAHSERAMVPLAAARLRRPARDLQVLIGGLGAGHTLREALDLPGAARVVVAEIGQQVVVWNRRYFAAVNGDALSDPRVEVVIDDVLARLRSARARYDLILLDVDNGPGYLAAEGNAALYTRDGLVESAGALRPGGVLAVWSPFRNPTFAARLAQVFEGWEEVDTLHLPERDGEPADVIYLAWSPREGDE